MRTIHTCLLFLVFTVCAATAQALKKNPVTPKEYGIWHHMYEVALSDDGKWASYRFVYDGQRDTTFVREVKGKRLFSFPKARAKRLQGNWFGCTRDSLLELLHLSSHKVQRIPSVTQYAFAQDRVVVHVNQKQEALLLVKDSHGKELYRFENATQFSLNPSGTALLLLQTVNAASNLSLIPLSTGVPERIATVSGTPLGNMTWEDKGTSVAFVDNGAQSPALYLYRIGDKKLFRTQKEGNWNGEIITGLEQLAFSSGGSQILFWTHNRKILEADPNVRVWNAQDDFLLIRREKFPHFPKTLCIWQPATGKVQAFDNKDIAQVTANARFALRKDQKPYLPSHKLEPDADYYLVDVMTGEERLLLAAYGTPKSITLLPDGQSLLYFREANWWRYTMASGKHENLTGHLPVSFVHNVFESRNTDLPIAIPMVADDGSAILLYDTHDIWKLDGQGKNPVRLTRGREKGQVFRVAEVDFFKSGHPSWRMGTGKMYKAGQPHLLTFTTEDYSQYGVGWLEEGKEFRSVYRQPKQISIAGRFSHGIFVTEESFASPPELRYLQPRKAKPLTVVQSNPKHKDYAWGHTGSIQYSNSKGVPLQGVLFYPANYDATKKYPMVVSIYQKRGKESHEYSPPSLYNAVGFNTSNLTNKGYFVLFPDIVYERNNPGHSATDCVMAAVKSALEVKAIDPANVALVGHSFGGYETNFIVTQTSFFKAAIASAGVTDLTSRYFSLSENHTAPETWRFEYQQARMEGPLFEHRAQYRSNSPIEHVEHVKTPLLTWTGEKDTQVNPYQSMEFHIALRRLGKPHIMLVYPEEGHVVLDPEKQKDLTLKMEEWLDYYLKGGIQPPWMKANYQYQTQ